MCRLRDDVVFGYDWANSSTADPRDKYVNWGDPSSVQESYWFKGYREGVKAQVKAFSQLPMYHKLVLICIEGGRITQLEAKTMADIR